MCPLIKCDHQNSRLRCKLCPQKKSLILNFKDIILECRSIFNLNSIVDILLRRQRKLLLACTSLDNNLIRRSVVSNLSTNWLTSLCVWQDFSVLTSFFSLSSFAYTVSYCNFGEIKLNIYITSDIPYSASESSDLWRYTNVFIICILLVSLLLLC